MRILLPDLKSLHQKIKLSESNDGDGINAFLLNFELADYRPAISAIVIAIQIILRYCKKLKYQRRIVLVTNARGLLDPDQISEITGKIKQEGIELVVV